MGSLRDWLAESLPKGSNFKFYHVSTAPTRCAALYIPLPGRDAERTYCESHLLLVTAKHNVQDVAIFALEVQVYTTAFLTTVFVSKADSTGFASLFPSTTSPSPIRSVTATFVSWLVRHRHRNDRRLVVSLFARSQGQYLFPGSAEYSGKHILDDRGLVRWWCKTLDPVLREYTGDNGPSKIKARGHLVVPDHDSNQTLSFLPLNVKAEQPAQRAWVHTDPLQEIATEPFAPPRCIIPHFPDDPKARFMDDLDEEIPDAPTSSQSQPSVIDSPSKRGIGQWKSVRTLEQFWEMMAHRQECSSGRIVGFLWIVFSPVASPSLSQNRPSTPSPIEVPSKVERKRKKRKLRGVIIPRTPRVKTVTSVSSQPAKTRYYYWPAESRGTLVLASKAYARLDEILHRLDFANFDVASASTEKWVREAGVIAGRRGVDWGVSVTGRRDVSGDEPSSRGRNEDPNVLGGNLVRKRPRAEEPVNTLGSNLVRKKPKV